jgi:hypothetical protein
MLKRYQAGWTSTIFQVAGIITRVVGRGFIGFCLPGELHRYGLASGNIELMAYADQEDLAETWDCFSLAEVISNNRMEAIEWILKHHPETCHLPWCATDPLEVAENKGWSYLAFQIRKQRALLQEQEE